MKINQCSNLTLQDCHIEINITHQPLTDQSPLASNAPHNSSARQHLQATFVQLRQFEQSKPAQSAQPLVGFVPVPESHKTAHYLAVPAVNEFEQLVLQALAKRAHSELPTYQNLLDLANELKILAKEYLK